MAESSNSTASRGNSGRSQSRQFSGKKSATGVKNTNVSGGAKDILSKEEEYKKLNAELEAKTANLVKEAEEVLKEQESVLSRSRLLDNINTEEFLKEFDEDVTGPNEDISSSKPPSRPGSKLTNQTKSQPNTRKPTSAKSRPKSRSNVADNVAIPDAFMTDFKDFSIDSTVSNIEGRLDRGDISLDDADDDIIPQAANDMGSEATIRFLKAKLRVMQEELDRLSQDCNKKDEESNSLKGKIKELEDERGRLHRTNAAQQTQIDKFKKNAEDAKNKSESLETQLTGVRKELEQLKRSQKQQTSNQSATEVRLNRALEEIERYKEQLHRAKSSSKDATDTEKKKVDQLLADNKRLEKQKNELMAGFKKQLKLIDIIKRQKMHIEAAKMLAFSEEEFVKALEWGS